MTANAPCDHKLQFTLALVGVKPWYRYQEALVKMPTGRPEGLAR